ncbi:extracellular solute-binding protein family 3 [Candidatus Moduliflexus flocculans]|uniref:Extracellular solute-binding protein family 3 n=1 Tax=Candidatus Moduliflexus flocculans TaxID=1499966 RepID=A0A081BRL9_9BACT|nr:extracellular solute-binding protein family 3 [Candidatus Moduliflexus flocculans]
MPKRKRMMMTGALIFAMAALIAWGAFERRDQSFARLQRANVIHIGYAVEAPFAFLEAGDVTGAFPEIAKRVANALGIARIEWMQADFDALIPALEAGRIDVIAAGLFITQERAQRVAFSEPVIRVQQSLLVQKGNPRGLHSYQAAATRADVSIAVIAGAVEETILRQIGVPDAQIIVVPDALTGHVAVKSGMVDGLALSAPTIRWMALRSPLTSTEVAAPFEQPDLPFFKKIGYAAFAIRQTDRRLLSAWNRAQSDLMKEGDYLALLTAFGFDETELPENITTKELSM